MYCGYILPMIIHRDSTILGHYCHSLPATLDYRRLCSLYRPKFPFSMVIRILCMDVYGRICNNIDCPQMIQVWRKNAILKMKMKEIVAVAWTQIAGGNHISKCSNSGFNNDLQLFSQPRGDMRTPTSMQVQAKYVCIYIYIL